MGLLAVATLLVDFIALKFMPLRTLYAQYKTVQSVDIDEMTPEDLKLFVEHDVINPHPLERKQVHCYVL